MTQKLTVYLAQLNPFVGALDRNASDIAAAYDAGCEAGADLVVTPELSVIGYPSEDLVLKPFFQRSVKDIVQQLATLTGASDTGLIVGAPWLVDGVLHNAILLLAGGDIAHIGLKRDLPNYGVFDEKRVFEAAPKAQIASFRGVKLGLMICEDMWFPHAAAELKAQGAEILIIPTASPFSEYKNESRLKHARARVAETGLPLVFCNQCGAQDELVFDGSSFALSASGALQMQCKAFATDTALIVAEKNETGWKIRAGDIAPQGDRISLIYAAVTEGLRSYVDKNGFPGVVLGMSGGIDSALSAAIAVDALGPERVHAVMMPSRYTSDDSVEDAALCAKALGIRYDVISIRPGVQAFDDMLAGLFAGQVPDLTEENIQSRLRGMLLMALSNKFGAMVLTTGNKSEVSVGYATLYGDMCGGYNALKDIYKMDVFALSAWRNTNCIARGLGPGGLVIPKRIITKPPTAELREDQRDDDSLPPYERLDGILRGLVDEDCAASELISRGFGAEEVARVEHLLYIAEYKRRQAAPGVKISEMLFGRDRRYPITNGFRSARR